MRKLIVTALFITVLFLSACDLSSPNAVRSGMVDALHPYFPNAQVLLRDDIAIGLSCLDTSGPALVQTVADTLPSLPGVKSLREAKKSGGTYYRYLGIGFPENIVRYDFETEKIEVIQSDSSYIEEYRNLCGVQKQTRPFQYAYLGAWNVSYTTDKGENRTTIWYDTLGAYGKEEQFTLNRNTEIKSREGVIRAKLKERGWTVIDLTLKNVSRVPVSRDDFNRQELPLK